MSNTAQTILTAPEQTTAKQTSIGGPDISVIKNKMKATWQDGDYAMFAKFMEPGAKEILKSWNVAPGVRMLDIGCGAGQTAIPAAQTGVIVTGIDIAANLIDSARRRASAEGVTARFDEGDAENLPYGDGEFDVVISMIGAMFAPRPEKVASELARVCRPGGRLYMANWTPRGFPGQMFKCIGRHVPPPLGVVPPPLWGDEETVTKRLTGEFTDIRLTRKCYPRWNYPFSVPELVEYFRTYFGPVKRAFAVLNKDGQQSFRQELEQIYANYSETNGATLTITGGEYLEVVATRR